MEPRHTAWLTRIRTADIATAVMWDDLAVFARSRPAKIESIMKTSTLTCRLCGNTSLFGVILTATFFLVMVVEHSDMTHDAILPGGGTSEAISRTEWRVWSMLCFVCVFAYKKRSGSASTNGGI